MRVFPISNWTELDMWQYIYFEGIPIVPLYFAAERPVVERDGTLIMVDDERMPLQPGENAADERSAVRTLGCYPLTGADRKRCRHVADDHSGNAAHATSERQGRVIDYDQSASMEKKKHEGYF